MKNKSKWYCTIMIVDGDTCKVRKEKNAPNVNKSVL